MGHYRFNGPSWTFRKYGLYNKKPISDSCNSKSIGIKIFRTKLKKKENIMEESDCCNADRYLGTDLCSECQENAEFYECEE